MYIHIHRKQYVHIQTCTHIYLHSTHTHMHTHRHTTHTYTHTYTQIYTDRYTQTYTDIYTDRYTYTYTQTHTQTYTQIYTHIHTISQNQSPTYFLSQQRSDSQPVGSAPLTRRYSREFEDIQLTHRQYSSSSSVSSYSPSAIYYPISDRSDRSTTRSPSLDDLLEDVEREVHGPDYRFDRCLQQSC